MKPGKITDFVIVRILFGMIFFNIGLRVPFFFSTGIKELMHFLVVFFSVVPTLKRWVLCLKKIFIVFFFIYHIELEKGGWVIDLRKHTTNLLPHCFLCWILHFQEVIALCVGGRKVYRHIVNFILERSGSMNIWSTKSYVIQYLSFKKRNQKISYTDSSSFSYHLVLTCCLIWKV